MNKEQFFGMYIGQKCKTIYLLPFTDNKEEELIAVNKDGMNVITYDGENQMAGYCGFIKRLRKASMQRTTGDMC